MNRTIVSKTDIGRWMREEGERQAREAAERRAEFFATRSDIPDLEFLTPDCSVCGLPTYCDDGSFECSGCHILWPRNGYGHEAERYDDNGDLL